MKDVCDDCEKGFEDMGLRGVMEFDCLTFDFLPLSRTGPQFQISRWT